MTATVFDIVKLQRWFVDYLVTNVGCSPDEVDLDLSLNDLGVGSRDAVVLSGELAELVGRPVSPVEFWQYPSVNSLISFLMTPEAPSSAADTVVDPGQRGALDDRIAVVGLGCRFPGDISGPEALWRFLSEGGSAIGEVPPERWASFDDGSAEMSAALSGTTRWGSFLKDIDAFDAEFFEISPREAAKMDPQQRLLLEVAWEALEHAGIPPTSLRRSQTAVFAGACISEYGHLASTDIGQVDAWTNTGGALSIIANRLSYFLDLRGPSVAVDTACSSSLVAIHMACQSLRTGESELAIAAGVNLLMSPSIFRGFDEAGALSTTGRCHAFDASADGFVRGEGCGVVVLKRLSDAVRDGDRVLAVVRGSAVNQDGRSNGLMAPNPAAQVAVLRAAYRNAGIQPSEVDYVEAHGTGTLLGDPIEARALGSVLGRGRPASSPLLIGAVKSNLGHLEAAAGVAGFIKAVLAVQRGHIPANLGFHSPNPHIPFDDLRLKVVADHQDWPTKGRPRRAGVSSFGFGGTNAHVVIEQAPEPDPVPVAPTGAPTSTLVVSGKTPERIASLADALADWMSGPGAAVALADVAHTLSRHRGRHPKFATVCARDHRQAVAGLRALAAGGSAPGVVATHDGPCGPGTVFVYSGQGSQWAGMARQLLTDEPAFANAIDEIEPLFAAEVGFSLRQILAGNQRASANGAGAGAASSPASRRAAARMAARAHLHAELRGDAQVQPVLMGLQLGLTALWRSYGVEPDAVIGHSMGEVAAAVVAGALTVSQGLQVIAARSRLMSQLAGQGAVALLELDAQATTDLITRHPEVSLAVYASPTQTVIAGPPAHIDELIATVQQQNRFAHRVNMEVASHNPIMDSILPELRAALDDLTPTTPTIPIFATANDDPTTTPVFDADYWVANIRNPVRFHQAITHAGIDHHTFIEISPHPMMAHAISQALADTHHHSIGTLRRDTHDTHAFHTSLNATYTTHPPETPNLPRRHVELPNTPWHRSRHWVSATPTLRATRRTKSSAGQGDSQADSDIPPDWHYELGWPARPLPDAGAVANGSWLVLADPSLGAEINRAAGGDSSVTVIAPSVLDENSDPTALLSALPSATNVLYAPDASSAHLDAASGYRLFNAGRKLAAALAATASTARLFVLTRNAQPLSPGDRANAAHAVLWGLGRTLALEQPEIWGGLVDVDDMVPAELAAAHVLAESRAADGEDQVVYRAGIRHVPRLESRSAPSASAVGLNPGTSHLVVGATGNIGPHLIGQLAQMGAATIVAVSRNPGSRLDELTQALAAQGTNVVTVAADATDPGAMKALFDRFDTDLPPLDGIYLAAFGGGPVTLRDMTDDDVTAMFRPKLDTLSLLHQLSLKTPVSHFVLFSSISGLLGSRWLAHYTATSGFLDTFAYARRNIGLPATVVNWGLWKSLSDSQSDEQQRLSIDSGLLPMADAAAIPALASAMAPDAGVRSVVVAADWDLLAAAYRTRASLHIIDELPAGADQDAATVTPGEFREALQTCKPERRRDMLVAHIAATATAVMGLSQSQTIDPSTGFFQLGMDSLVSVLLQRALSQSLGETLPPSLVFDYPTVDAVADYLTTILPQLSETTGPAQADVYESFTEAQLLQQLSERLS